jgi:hypothetical protein
MPFWIGSGMIRPKYKIILSLFSDLYWRFRIFVSKKYKGPVKGKSDCKKSYVRWCHFLKEYFRKVHKKIDPKTDFFWGFGSFWKKLLGWSFFSTFFFSTFSFRSETSKKVWIFWHPYWLILRKIIFCSQQGLFVFFCHENIKPLIQRLKMAKTYLEFCLRVPLPSRNQWTMCIFKNHSLFVHRL